jgi:transposase
MFILQEQRIDQRAEFDWGEVTLSIEGMGQKFYLAVFVLPFSLYRFARLYHHSACLEVIQAHIEFFHEIGSVPETIIYDRMAVVFDSRKQQLNDTFWGFPCIPVFVHVSAIRLHRTKRVQTKKVWATFDEPPFVKEARLRLSKGPHNGTKCGSSR